MRKHFFKRLFVLSFLGLLALITFLELYATNVVRTNHIDELKNSLAIQASLISEGIPFNAGTDFNMLCRELKKKTGARVTLIAQDGRVLGDSDNDSAFMDNHAGRPEIQQANISGTGSFTRYSETLRYDLLYVAKKITANNKSKGFIRLALPLNELNKSINALRVKINLVVIVLLLISVSILTWQTNRIRKYVNMITVYAGALSRGLFRKRLYIEGAGEFSELAESLNEMAVELESALRERDEETNQLSVILKSIPDALLLINTNDIVELSNTAAKALFGTVQLEGRPYVEILRSPDFSAIIGKVKRDRASGSVDLVMDFPEERHLSVRVSPLSYKIGELSGYVAIFHDTTQMRRLEQMRKDFVANVSHEIKTPVTAIKGFAETLLDGALADKENAETFLHTIATHSDRLNRLVEDLLTLSRIELGVIKINKNRFNLNDAIEKAAGTLVVQAAKKSLAIRTSCDKEDTMINADRDKVQQILLNLLDNAIKFTEQGEIVAGTAEEAGKAFFYVKDSGTGIPEKHIPRVGERFFRVDPSRSRELGGTGLGLAIVKHIVKAHGWVMKVESKMGKGTVVKIFYQ